MFRVETLPSFGVVAVHKAQIVGRRLRSTLGSSWRPLAGFVLSLRRSRIIRSLRLRARDCIIIDRRRCIGCIRQSAAASVAGWLASETVAALRCIAMATPSQSQSPTSFRSDGADLSRGYSRFLFLPHIKTLLRMLARISYRARPDDERFATKTRRCVEKLVIAEEE